MGQVLSIFSKRRLPAPGLILIAAQAPVGGDVATVKTTLADEPGFAGLSLPVPDPAFPNGPAGCLARVDDGPESGLSPGIFGLNRVLDPPGTQHLEGGLNFGGLLHGGSN